MKIGVFSQTVGNPQRTDRILNALKQQEVSHVYFLGDLINRVSSAEQAGARRMSMLATGDKRTIEIFDRHVHSGNFKSVIGLRGPNEDFYLRTRDLNRDEEETYATFLERFYHNNSFLLDDGGLAYAFTSTGFTPEERTSLKVDYDDIDRTSSRLREMLHSAQRLNRSTKVAFVGRTNNRYVLMLNKDSKTDRPNLDEIVVGEREITLPLYDSDFPGVIVAPSTSMYGYCVLSGNQLKLFE
jgi:hypothetical protein